MKRFPVRPFHQNPKSRAVLLEDFDQCVSVIAECEHTAGIRVEMEFQFDDCGQTGVALAKIRNLSCQIDHCTSGKIKHNPPKPVGARP